LIECSRLPTFSAASLKLGITQPALSESIKRLESDVGGALFYRSKSGISLTPLGRKVLDYARTAVDAIDFLERQNSQLEDAHGLVSIVLGCHPLVASYVLPQALLKISKQVRLTLRHERSRVIQDEVQRGIIDLGLVVNPISNPDLVIRKLGTDTVKVWTAKAHHLSGQSQLFCDPELVQTQAILRKWKARPERLVASSSLELVTRLTCTGTGFGILPERAVRIYGPDLIEVQGAPRHQDQICLLHRPEFGRNEFEKKLIRSLVLDPTH
jgi:DNA-binding transcriptional LysR family regulator